MERFHFGQNALHSYEALKKETLYLTEAFQIKDTIYFRYKDRVMPCVRTGEGTYRIKTVLYWSMVEKKLKWIKKIQSEKFTNILENNYIIYTENNHLSS